MQAMKRTFFGGVYILYTDQLVARYFVLISHSFSTLFDQSKKWQKNRRILEPAAKNLFFFNKKKTMHSSGMQWFMIWAKSCAFKELKSLF